MVTRMRRLMTAKANTKTVVKKTTTATYNNGNSASMRNAIRRQKTVTAPAPKVNNKPKITFYSAPQEVIQQERKVVTSGCACGTGNRNPKTFIPSDIYVS